MDCKRFIKNKNLKRFGLYFLAFYFFIMILRLFTTAGSVNLLMQQGYQILFAVLFAGNCALWNFSRKNTVFYVVIALLWCGAAFCKIGADMVLSEREIIQTLGVGTIFYTFFSVLYYSSIYIKKSWLQKTARFLILGLFAVSMLPALLVIGYFVVSDGHLLSANILLTLFQTNPEEVMAYLAEQNVWLWAVSVLAILVISGVLIHVMKTISTRCGCLKLLAFNAVLVIYMVLGILPKATSCFTVNMIIRVGETLRVYKEYNAGGAARQARLQELKNILQTDDEAQLHILVMGESTMRNHLSAFGYQRPNTPWMDKMLAENENALIYPRAYSSNIQTVMSVQFALTEQNQYAPTSLLESYSITELATAAGYDTYWISNQKQFNTYDTPITTVANSAEHRIYINDYIGNKTMTTYYDEKLAEQFPDLKAGQKTFIIFHLMGCHAVYIDRYPSEYAKFSGGADARVDAYDNCVLYNDHVLALLYDKARQNPDFMSFIFLSDHGEDPDKGLTHDYSKFTWNMAHIPFFTLFSEKYAAEHPEVIAALQDNHEKYWTSDLLYNSMAHIMGIHNVPRENTQFDIASPQYDMPLEKLTIIEGSFHISEDDSGQ